MNDPGRLRRFSANAAGMLQEASGARPDATALVDADEEITYAALADRGHGFAERLRRIEVQPGDRVAILLRRGADAAAAFFGTLAAGAIAVAWS